MVLLGPGAALSPTPPRVRPHPRIPILAGELCPGLGAGEEMEAGVCSLKATNPTPCVVWESSC